MTTLNPIDLERESIECVALIDLENIRLSWQRTYSRVFEYADLVLLCGLTERLMDTQMSRIIVFATDPEQYRAQQVKVTAMREGLLQGGVKRTLSDHEVSILEKELVRRGVALSEDVQAGFRLIEALSEDVAATAAWKRIKSVSAGGGSIEERTKRVRVEELAAGAHVGPGLKIYKSDQQSASISGANNDKADDAFSVISEDDASDDSEKSSEKQILLSSSSSSTSSSLASSHCSSAAASELEEEEDDCQIIVGEDDIEFLGEKKAASEKKAVNNAASQQRPGQKRSQPESSEASSHKLSGMHGQRQIELRLYGFKNMKGRVVQRGCDVALGSEITKACFHPNVDKIVLFSADSDFQELMEQNIQPEDIGGVLKFAKTSWVCGFRQAFHHLNLRGLGAWRGMRSNGTSPHFRHGVFQRGNLRYVVLDEVFPQIRRALESRQAKRIMWIPAPPPATIP